MVADNAQSSLGGEAQGGEFSCFLNSGEQEASPSDIWRSAVAAEMRRRGYHADAKRYEDCCRPGLGLVEFCPDCEQDKQSKGFYHRFIPFRCMSRVCPHCGSYLASGVQDRYMPLVRILINRPIPADWRAPWDRGDSQGIGLKHVVLTRTASLGGPDTETVIKGTLDAARELVHRMGWHSGEMGAIASLEVGERGHRFHVHLLVYGPFRWKSVHSERTYQAQNALPLRASSGPYLSETWEELTGDSIVHIRPVKDESEALYALKYVIKGIENLTPEQAVDLHVALKGSRRVRAWGVFYGKAAKALLAAEGDDGACEADMCHCPRCGARTVWVPRAWFDEVMGRHCALIDLIRTNKSSDGERGKGPPNGPESDPRMGSDGHWKSESFLLN